MKKIKILSHPIQISTIELNDLEFSADLEEKMNMSRTRKPRKVRS